MPRINQTIKKATQTNAIASVTFPLNTDRRWRIVKLLASYKATAQAALTVTLSPAPTTDTPTPPDVVVLDADVKDFADLSLPQGLQMPGPGLVTVALAAGGAGIVGKLNVVAELE